MPLNINQSTQHRDKNSPPLQAYEFPQCPGHLEASVTPKQAAINELHEQYISLFGSG